MSAAWGAQRPVISATEAERWAGEARLRFPELVADEAPEWVWHDGGEGRYVGYLPTDWNAPIEDYSYERIGMAEYAWEAHVEAFFDLGVCTMVGRLNGFTDYFEVFTIPAITRDEIGRWQTADGDWFNNQFDESTFIYPPVFEGFEEFEREMRSEELGLPDDESDVVAEALAFAEHRGPYSKWVLELRALDDGRFLGLGGPPGRDRRWKFQREFETLEDATAWIKSAAESIGTAAEPGSEWQDRWPE